MQLSLINLFEDVPYVRIHFHENSDELVPPVIIRLKGKEMKALKLSEELNAVLRAGWVEVFSTNIILGGVWTNKGYLPLSRIDEQ